MGLFFGFVGVEWLGEVLVFRREMVWEWMRLRGICAGSRAGIERMTRYG